MSGTYVEAIDAALAEVQIVVERGQAIRERRSREGRRLGAETRRRLAELQAALEQLVGEPSELDLAYREIVERQQ